MYRGLLIIIQIIILIQVVFGNVVEYDPERTFNQHGSATFCRLDCTQWQMNVKKNPLVIQMNNTLKLCDQFQPGSLLWFSDSPNPKLSSKKLKEMIKGLYVKDYNKTLSTLHDYYLDIRSKCFFSEPCDYSSVMRRNPFPLDLDREKLVKMFEDMIAEDENLCSCSDFVNVSGFTSNYLQSICRNELVESMKKPGIWDSCHEIFLKSNDKSNGIRRLTNGNDYFCDLKRGWTLVRRMEDYWAHHDKLRGDIAYGVPSNISQFQGDWSLPFRNIPFTSFKFQTGDKEKWIVVEKNSVYDMFKSHGRKRVKIEKSHHSSKPHFVFWTIAKGGYPLISTRDTDDKYYDVHALLYAEDDLPSEEYSDWRDNHQGINIWIK